MISVAGVDFEKRPGVEYKYDYEKMLDDARAGVMRGGEKGDPKALELSTLRALILDDLWFVVYFVMRPWADDLGKSKTNHPFVVSACREIEVGPKSMTLDVWAREHYKAVDINEPVPTPEGWTLHGNLRVGDTVFGPDGEPCKVVGRTRIFEDADCYRVTFNDGYSAIVSGDHLWSVEKRTRRRVPMTYKTKGVPQRIYREPSVVCTRDMLGLDHSPDNRLAVRVTDPVKFEEQALPIPPYTLGAWLGDGNSAGARITCAYADQEIIENIRYGDGVAAKERKSSNRNSGLYQLGDGIHGKSGTGLTWKLRVLGVLNNKHIPKMYLQNSVANRAALLKGLMDTDGTCDTRGTATFANINHRLACDVFELAASLGLCPHQRLVKTKVNGEPYESYQISFQAYKSFRVFGLKRKLARCKDGVRKARQFIVSVKPVEPQPVSCIQVDRPDGCYLIGKNFVTTHNSTIITKAETIQFILANPEAATGIFSHTRPAAKKFMDSIRGVFQTSELMKACFPDVVWPNCERDAPLWSDEGLVLRRKSTRSEPTVSAWGLIEGMPIGAHFERMIFDDIVTDDIKNSVEMMEKVKEKFDVAQNLGKEGGHHRVVGTFYHHNDPLVYIRGKKTLAGETQYPIRLKPGSDDGTATGKPVLISQERFDFLKGTMGFNTQILCNPTPQSDQKLNFEYMNRISRSFIPKGRFRMMLIDQAGDQASNKTGPGDSWAIAIIGVEPQKDDIGQSRRFLEDLWVQPANESEAIEQAIRMFTRSGIIHKLGVEQVGQVTTHLHIAAALKARGRHVEFSDNPWTVGKMLRPAGRNKKKFIEGALSWPLNNGKWHYADDIPNAFLDRLRMEMVNFPVWHDDVLNVMSYSEDVIKDCNLEFYEVDNIPRSVGEVMDKMPEARYFA